MNLSELRTALKERREDYSSSAAKLNRKINQAYLDICSRRKWGWLRREYTANTHAPHTVTGYGPPVGPPPPAATPNFTATPGSRRMTFETGIGTAGGQLPANSMGKRLLVGGSFYRIVQMDAGGSAPRSVDLDRPYTGSAFPVVPAPPGLPDYGSAQVVYDEIALPLGAQSIVHSVLFDGVTSYPLSLDAVQPATMSGSDKNSFGRPTHASAVEKTPISKPKTPIGALSAGWRAGGLLTPGATYTYWYTHYDEITGAESSLSVPATVTIAASENAVIVPTITARTDFFVRLYRSDANGSIPYLLRDDENGAMAGFDDEVSDDYLGAKGPESGSSMYLSLYPSPSSAYQVHLIYQSGAKTLGGDTDVPLFDNAYSNVLLDGAELLMLSANDEQPRAGHVQQRYEAGIQRMVRQDRMNFQQKVLFSRGSRGVSGRPNWWYGSLPNYGSGGLGGFGAP